MEQALEFLAEAYTARLLRPGRTSAHPVAVAALLAEHGEPPAVVVAGALHDVLEDTEVTSQELARRFGDEVARLVIAASQDPAIGSYAKRKTALRRQILDAGPQVASITLADKVAKLRATRVRPRRRRLAHYQATLDGVEQRYGRSELSELLREQLGRWDTS